MRFPPEEGGSIEGGRLFIGTLRVLMPKNLWTGGFSSAHPAVRMEVLNRTDLSRDTSVSDYWIGGAPPGIWASEIESYRDVLRVESLAEVADGCIYRVTYENPPVIDHFRRLRLPIQFPLKIQAGRITWEVIAHRTEFEEWLAYAQSRDPELQISSIRHRPLHSHLPVLTEAQHRLLTEAMNAGYFAVPRGTTLTELARRLGRSKSALSEALARIEEKLLASALRPSTLLP